MSWMSQPCRAVPSGGREVFSGDVSGMDDIIGIIESGWGWIFLDFLTSKFLPRFRGM